MSLYVLAYYIMLSSKLGQFGKIAHADLNIGDLVAHSSTTIACQWTT